jgi:hypothetical protein
MKMSHVRTLLTIVAAKCATLLKLSLVIGSQGALLFSGVSMISPLLGLFGGITSATLFFAINFLLRCVMGGFPGLSILAMHVPGWCAGLYLASSHWLIRLLVPLGCIGLFLVHPVGGSAAAYSVYWLIPVVLFSTSHKSLFLHALGATFTAHAVGSVIWLYTTTSTPSFWLSLISLVALERLTYAAGLVVMHCAIVWVAHGVMRLKSLYRVRSASSL